MNIVNIVPTLKGKTLTLGHLAKFCQSYCLLLLYGHSLVLSCSKIATNGCHILAKLMKII